MYISGPDLAFTGATYEQFLADYEEILGQAPLSAFHAHAYDAANMIFDAIEQVAQTDAEGNTVIGRQALRDALYATSNFDGITGNLSCNEMVTVPIRRLRSTRSRVASTCPFPAVRWPRQKKLWKRWHPRNVTV